jgi:hypothetical protein
MRRHIFVLTLALCAEAASTHAIDKQCKADPRGNAFGYWSNCGTASATVSVEGGTVTTPAGASVTVPAGAVDRPVTITLQTATATAPPGIGAVSPVYQFGPEGTVFAKPVTVSLPLQAGVTDASIYWSKLGSTTEFEPIGGTIANGFITVETPHFSRAVIGAASPVRTVNGVGKTTWISATARQTLPQDFTTIPVEAIVCDVSGCRSIPAVPGTGAALGTFTIPGVPRGQYTLHAGDRYLVTNTSSPDLGTLRGGRPDVTPLGNHSALLDFRLMNLAWWQSGSLLELFSTEADDWDFDTGRVIDPPLADGQTELLFTFDLAFTDAGTPSLIRGSKGDHLYFAQLSNATSPTGAPYVAMSRLIQFPLFDTVVDGTVHLEGTLLDVQQTNSIAADFRGSAFSAAMAAEANPRSVLDCQAGGCIFAVVAQPGTRNDGFYGANADLLILNGLSDVDLLTGTMTYGSPANAGLVGSWGEMGVVRWNGRVSYQLFGTLPASIASGIEWTADARAFALPRVVTPPISFVRNPRIDGVDAFADQTLASTTPTVS